MHAHRKCLLLLATLATLALPLATTAQTTSGILKGQVTDVSGSAIPGADVTITNGKNVTKTFSTDETGTFTATGLASGNYSVQVAKFGFANYLAKTVPVTAGKTQSLSIPLELQASKQEVTVAADSVGTVSTDPSQNGGQLVLKGTDLEALPDDPDDLAADLQALAGPAAGPNGGQVYIDGFTGGNLPPKSSIREIRINQNPFSAEYDRLGFGRIEILTKPGTDKYRGTVFFNDSDSAFNSRNPYLVNSQAPSIGGPTDLNPTFQSKIYGGNIGGPINKKASFFLDFQRRDIDDNAIINATRLDASLNPYLYSQSVPTPNRNTEVSPRIDYQINANNTLVMRYSFEDAKQTDAGLGTFNLPSTGYNTTSTENRVQITETAVLNARTINETRFQFLNDRSTEDGNNSLPSINVSQSFIGGGSQVGNSWDTQRHYELQNYTSMALGTHSIKFGGRIRAISDDNNSSSNFGGTFVFAGGLGPQLDANNQPIPGAPLIQLQSIERYRRTLLFQSQGLSPEAVRALGGGASQFSIASGNPYLSVPQVDFGFFVMDDWRVRPNLTLSGGLRYENQTNISSNFNFAPRLSFAWSPGAGKTGRAKTVIRGGSGIFYSRFSETYVLNAERFNGVNQINYTVDNPNFFPNVPPPSSLTSSAPLVTRTIDPALQTPYNIQSQIGVERQLPRNITVTLIYLNSHLVHQYRSRNINAPYLDGYDPAIPTSGNRPYGNAAGNIYQYESGGLYNQNQLITNVQARVNANFSLFGFYMFSHANSNTDGVQSFPGYTYDLTTEYGRSSLDVRNRAFIGGSIVTKFALRWSPFILASSGAPFDITTGTDSNGDLQYTDRPSFASPSQCGTSPTIICNKYGNFNLRPASGDRLIPRNYGDGPGSFTVNLRLSRTWGFGESSGRPSGGSMDGGPGGGGPGGGGGRGPGGMGRGGFGGGGGMGGIFGGGNTNKRYNMTLSINARNLLNHVNQGVYSGNLLSPYFGKANSLANGFGPPGGQTNNRRLEFSIRFSF